MHYLYPIEQIARSVTTRFQMGFARMTMHLMPEIEDVCLEPSNRGLKILGADETALAKPGEIIRQIYADSVAFDRPRVRLVRDSAVCEPVMWVRAAVPNAHTESAVQDLVARDASIEEVDWLRHSPVVRARAPLRKLLGYPAALARLTGGTAELRMWLSHYAPVKPEGGDAA